MPITAQQKAAAEAAQHRAARSRSSQIRLLAGPGTGKSHSILERVRWLVASGYNPNEIAAVSFTRAAARDLRQRIYDFGIHNGLPQLTQIRVSTLHSLALSILRNAGMLVRYPVDPVVLDDWELQNVLDAEFGGVTNIRSVTRQQAIRRNFEAFCSTRQWNPPGLPQARPPVTQTERQRFTTFLRLRAQVYSCVLPGELVKMCVDEANAGTLDIAALTGFTQLIVDEYQDLNTVDLEFVDILARSGVTLFVSGDDDQSVYAFRYAAPEGIQQFHNDYASADCLTLEHCFRCTPAVLNAAYSVVEAFPDPGRLAKTVTSLYVASNPPVPGVLHCWSFGGSRIEAEAMARSCQSLIQAGLPPEEIMILLSSTPVIARPLVEALANLGVPFREPRPDAFKDTKPGRYGLCLLRVAERQDHYLAMRVLMGLQTGIGIGTCNAVAQTIVATNTNLGDLVTQPLPPNLFRARALSAIRALRRISRLVAGWSMTDQLDQRAHALRQEIETGLGGQAAHEWDSEIAALPHGTTLEETRAYVDVAGEAAKERVLGEINARLGVAPPPPGGGRVRIMTMHGSKGLSAQVVLIPGLEEGLLPSRHSAPYPGLVAESARLLFVSMSRARVACILSHADRRGMHGTTQHQTVSRFATAVGPWIRRPDGLSAREAQTVVAMSANL